MIPPLNNNDYLLDIIIYFLRLVKDIFPCLPGIFCSPPAGFIPPGVLSACSGRRGA
jgi:hypothetical protein